MPKSKSKPKNISSSIPSLHHYTYPNSVTLKNKFGIKDFQTFVEKCSHESTKAMINLREEPLPEKFDSSYLKHLHCSLFKSTFEWAGHTRDELFTFSDGSIATMPGMQKKDSDVFFAVGDEIQEGLQRLDKALAEKNNLQGLTREEFISEAAKIFVLLNHTHPFREGNGRTQRLFLERLGHAAGHKLDFSLVTEKRMSIASIAAERNGNLEPINHLFEDISNPEKVCLLKEFISDSNIKDTGPYHFNKIFFATANEGATYTGIYKGANSEAFMIDIKGSYIIGKKEHLTPEQLKTLKSGDEFTFTTPKAEELKKVLIPKEQLASLTKSELSEKIAEDACVHTSRDQIQHFSKIVYGNSKALDKQMVEIIKDPNFGQQLVKQIERVPQSISPLAGIDLICFKNKSRAKAEEHIDLLCDAVTKYTCAVNKAEEEITQEHQAEQKRCGKAVEMPSKNLQDILSLPKELQQKALESSPFLQKELSSFIKDINTRLSSSEHKAIKNHNYENLAKSIGISENKAKEIAETIQKIREVHQHMQVCTPNRSKVLAMAS